MAAIVRWDLSQFSSRNLEVALAMQEPVQRRDYVLCMEGVDSQLFIDANPGWHYSESLQAPFKYVPTIEVAPDVFDLGIVSVPFEAQRVKLSARTWKRGAAPASGVFDALLVAALGKSTIKRTQIVQGSSEDS